jgi:Tfp pilus assembly protein PilN
LKTLHLNLASRPYRDYTPVYAVAIVLALITGFLMINNIQTAYRYFVNTEETRAEIARVEAQTATEIREAETLERAAAGINVRALAMETEYINAQIAERSFSWSNLLDNMERVLPPNVRLVTMNPTFHPEGGVNLAITARSKAHDGMINMLRTMLADPHFTDAFPGGIQQNDDGTYSFTLSTTYKPDPRGLLR